MTFKMFCQHKGCGRDALLLLDTATDKVYCDCEHQKELETTKFVKIQLLSFNQTLKNKKTQKQSYSVECPKCNHKGTPELKKNKILCTKCKEEMTHLSKPFAHMLKTNLKSLNQ